MWAMNSPQQEEAPEDSGAAWSSREKAAAHLELWKEGAFVSEGDGEKSFRPGTTGGYTPRNSKMISEERSEAQAALLLTFFVGVSVSPAQLLSERINSSQLFLLPFLFLTSYLLKKSVALSHFFQDRNF
jgi:hypothetical protein